MGDGSTPHSSITPPTIEATANGPFVVHGDVPLYRRRTVLSEHGEPITWQTTAQLPAESGYELCRCGHSANKPLCDGEHKNIGFTDH